MCVCMYVHIGKILLFFTSKQKKFQKVPHKKIAKIQEKRRNLKKFL